MWADVPFFLFRRGWMWPEIARYRPPVAPRVAPRSLVRRANIQPAGHAASHVVLGGQNAHSPAKLA